ncbi:MAG TPA: hypothetical protein VK611_19310 [Acidimicrobiales bacterium]|nr:hypothetical protein [Acidimicrobiales bacterium]
MTRHELDPVSLVGGILFLAFGVVGLLHGAGWIEGGSLFWAAVVVLAGLGAVGVARSVVGLLRVTPDHEAYDSVPPGENAPKTPS